MQKTELGFVYNDFVGFYRVNYDLQTWKNIIQILDSDKYDSVDEFDRSVLLDDMFNLARAGYLDYEILFYALKYLKRETKQLPIKIAINNLRSLMRYFETTQNDDDYKKIMVRISKFFENVRILIFLQLILTEFYKKFAE